MNGEGPLVDGAADEDGGIRAVDDDDDEEEEEEEIPVVIAAAVVVIGGGGGAEDFEVDIVVTTPAVDVLEETDVAAAMLVEWVVDDRLHMYPGQN